MIGLRVVDLAAHHHLTASAGHVEHLHVRLLRPVRVAGHLGQVGGEEQVQHRVGHARRGVEVDEVLEPAGLQPDLLDQSRAPR